MPNAEIACPKCGQRQAFDADTHYCDECGASLEGIEPQNQRSSSDNPGEVICPNCRAQVLPDGEDPHCPACGAPLQGVTPIDAKPDFEPAPGETDQQEPAQTSDAPAQEEGLVIVCPKCGARSEPDVDADFCDECGGALEGVLPVKGELEPPIPTDSLPVEGACPDCGGPVAVLSEDKGVCKRCGLKLETPQARSRRAWGLVLVLLAVGAWLAVRFSTNR